MTSSADNDIGPQRPEEFARMHQRSFRTAFDFLASHFPPGDTPEWWEQAAKDVAEASISMAENKLAVGLLAGVYDYLDYEYKRRGNNGTVNT